MCGIVGIITPQERIKKDDLIKMRDTMIHRGPDSGGIWVKQEEGAECVNENETRSLIN